MMAPKAQAAMEFLMTYGWAILVVLVVIGALAYFGVLSPTSILPEKCFFQVGLECEQYVVGNGQAQFIVRNNLGKKLTINSLKLIDENNNEVCSTLSAVSGIDNEKSGTITTFCNINSNPGDKKKFTVEIEYYTGNEISFTHTANGELLSVIEELDSPNIPLPGEIVLYSSFDNPLDEKTIDMGNGIIGTCTDPKCPIYLDNQGILGGAYSFEGDDFISIPDEDSLTRQIFSISVWVKPSELSEYDEIISKYNEFLIRRNGAYILFYLYEAAKPTAKWEPRVPGITLVDTVNWHHIVVTYDGRYMSSYVNGILQGTIDRGITLTNSPYNLEIGSWGSGANAFHGLIDEVIFWDKALSPSEVSTLYNSYS